MKNGISNWRTYSIFRPTAETNYLPSKTIPGQTLGLRELLERYVRGENVTTFQPEYDADSDLPDVSKMDKMDKLHLASEIRDHISEYQSKPKPKKPETVVVEPPADDITPTE